MLNWFLNKKMKREIIVNDEQLETRVAILENGRLEEFQVEHSTDERIVGSIFKGRIQNLEHDLRAAFVDIGMNKNAFLHYWDMHPESSILAEIDDGNNKRRKSRNSRNKTFSNQEVEKRFPAGSEIIVQVTKGPIGTKGPRVTTSISIPGRYLVLLPGTKLRGVSRKIGDIRERKRLKGFLDRMVIPDGVGLIFRTAAEGIKMKNLNQDLESILVIWKELQENIKTEKAPACVHAEPNLIERMIRDWISDDVDRVVVDSQTAYTVVKRITGLLSRKAKSRVRLYEGELPIFDYYEVERQLERALRRVVHLKCGAMIVVDETEALVAIDVNSGKYKGSGSQEDAILEINLEAVEEIARQLRLRNIGGLVVIDLIDMKRKNHQNIVYRAMKTALKHEKARTNVLSISELGLMEMTRQRVEESVLSSMYVDCPYCNGRGKVKSPLGISVEVQRQLKAVIRKCNSKEKPKNVLVEIHPSVLDRFRTEDEQMLIEMTKTLDGKLKFKSMPMKHAEFYSILDEDTNEVYYSNHENS
jgi:ribonuclease G